MWLTVCEAAKYFGKSTTTIYRWIEKGTLRSRLQDGVLQVLVQEGKNHSLNVSALRFNQCDLEPLFDAYENLLEIDRLFRRIITKHKSLSDGGYWSRLVSWTNQYEGFKRCFHEVDELVQKMTLKPTVLQGVYRAMVQIRLNWDILAEVSRKKNYESTSDQRETYHKGLSLLDDVIDELRTCMKECQRP